ncbi:hypothetical protein [Pseudorhodoplanes sp.]|uniref:hypothetical protein n=1 Tax=Pseudorhodoplanes sp. TaxID=1934341 RepID=UPI00391C5DD6
MIAVIVALTVIAAAVWYWRAGINGWLNRLKGWRTVIVNAIPAALIAAGQIVEYAASFPLWESIMSPQAAAWTLLGFNVANILLRVQTTTPVGRRD